MWGAAKTVSRRDFIALHVLLKNKHLKEFTSTFNLSWKKNKRAKVQKKKKKPIKIKIINIEAEVIGVEKKHK